MQQKRLLLALALSTAILLLWSYLFPVKPPQQQAPGPQPSPSPSASRVATPAVINSQIGSSAGKPAVQEASHRIVSIKTPLYEAKFDTHGAEPVSWIIRKNRSSGREIYSSASTRNNRVPLELISPEGLKRQPRDVPFQVITG